MLGGTHFPAGSGAYLGGQRGAVAHTSMLRGAGSPEPTFSTGPASRRAISAFVSKWYIKEINAKGKKFLSSMSLLIQTSKILFLFFFTWTVLLTISSFCAVEIHVHLNTCHNFKTIYINIILYVIGEIKCRARPRDLFAQLRSLYVQV